MEKLFQKLLNSTLAKSLFRQWLHAQICALIRKAESKGWTKGRDLPEEAIADVIVSMLGGEPVPAIQRKKISEFFGALIYGKEV